MRRLGDCPVRCRQPGFGVFKYILGFVTVFVGFEGYFWGCGVLDKARLRCRVSGSKILG